MREGVRGDGPEIAEEGLERGAAVIARDHRVVPFGFERIEKRECRVDVEVGDAEVRHGPSTRSAAKRSQSFQASRLAIREVAMTYTPAAVKRAMKVAEVLLQALKSRQPWIQVAETLGVSARTVRRWRYHYEKYGFDGLFDHRRRRPSPRAVPVAELQRVLRLYAERYTGFNVRHFHQILRREYGISWSYTFVKQALQGAHLVGKRRPRHRPGHCVYPHRRSARARSARPPPHCRAGGSGSGRPGQWRLPRPPHDGRPRSHPACALHGHAHSHQAQSDDPRIPPTPRGRRSAREVALTTAMRKLLTIAPAALWGNLVALSHARLEAVAPDPDGAERAGRRFGEEHPWNTYGLFTPEKAIRSATVKSPGVAAGRIGMKPPGTLRYELASRFSIRTKVSATILPPTGPSWLPPPRTAASRST